MPDSFQRRLEPGAKFEEELLNLLGNHQGIDSVARNGTEHTHPDFVARLRNNHSQQSKLIRHAPDGVILFHTGRVCHFDAKVSDTIERDAYESYMRHAQMGLEVLLFVKHRNTIYWQDIRKVRFLNSETIVMAYPPHRRFPIDKDGWICPRQKNGFCSNSKMSGTPYRYLDFESFNIWKEGRLN